MKRKLLIAGLIITGLMSGCRAREEENRFIETGNKYHIGCVTYHEIVDTETNNLLIYCPMTYRSEIIYLYNADGSIQKWGKDNVQK